MIRFTSQASRRLRLGDVVVAVVLMGCSSSSSTGGGPAAASSGPCDPLAVAPTTLGAILGVGQDTQSTLYVADEVPDSGQDRVFASSGTTLYRKHVAGSGGTGQPGKTTNADYTFSFEDPFADASGLRALLIQVRGGVVTGMALGPGGSRSFLGGGAGQVPLTVLDAGAVAGFKVADLPHVPQLVADISNGDVIVITEPMDPWSYSGFRLFYGKPTQMIERPIVNYSQAVSGPADITFTIDSANYVLHTTYVFGPDAGPLGTPGPATLDIGSGALTATLRLPTPQNLSGFSFTCSGP
jgi:hypothetical protein